jgi:hypothetical protein
VDRSLTTRQDLGVQADPVVRDPVGLGLAVRVGPTDRVGPVGRPRLGLVVRVDLVVPEDLGRVGLVRLVDLTVPAARLDRHRMVPVVLVPAGRGDLADLMDRTGLVVLVVLLAPVGLVVLYPMDRAGLAVRPGRMDLVARADPVAQAVPADLVDLVDLNTAARAAPVVLMARVVLVDPVGPNTAGPVAPVDRHRRPMCNAVSTIVVARSGVVRATRRTASVRPITARRPRHRNTASDGTVDLPRERRHPTGTGHRLLAAGTGRHLPVAGTPTTTGRHATSVWRSATLGLSTTGASAPSRSSTRYSAAGASGSWVRGSRCTDLARTVTRLTSRLLTKAGGQSFVVSSKVPRRVAGKECVCLDSVARCAAWLCTKAERWQTSISAGAS